MERSEALSALLEQTGFAGAKRTVLAGDASTRRYERLELGDRRGFLMDAAPRAEGAPCPPGATPAQRRTLGWNAMSRLAASRVEGFAAVAQYLKSLGLSAPEIYGVDVQAGFMILEDLGDDLFARVIPESANELDLYRAAAEALAQAHSAPPPTLLPAPNGGSWPLLDYDALALEVNMDLFVEWLPKQAAEIHISDAQRARWEKLRDALIVKALGFPRAFTIRDYHAENLIWLPERDGVRRVGLLDFQDAIRGWRAWDFAMLLDDARRDVSPEAREVAIRTYLDRTGSEDAPFRRELAVLGAINTMRILGIFARLVGRDNKPRYLEFMPREWGHLARSLQHPALAEAQAFVEEVARPYLEAAA